MTDQQVPMDLAEFMSDLDGGVLENKLATILCDVASAVIDHERVGKVKLEFDIKKIASSHQVQLNHKIRYEQPTLRGKVVEEDTTSTPMHVGTRGKMSLFPENQTQMFTKTGEPA